MAEGFLGLFITFCFGVFVGGAFGAIGLAWYQSTHVEMAENMFKSWNIRCAKCGRPPFIQVKKDEGGGPPATV